ncbi:MAG: TldD/PmbA family protein [Bacilli bacterium]
MISKKLASALLLEATAFGADFAEIYLEDTVSSNLSMENGKVEERVSTNGYGVGIRVLKGLQSAYGYTSDLSKKSLTKLAQDVAKAFSGERVLTPPPLEKVRVKEIINLSTQPMETISVKEKIDLLKEVNDTMAAYDKRIVRTNVYLNEMVKNVTIFNTLGRYVEDTRRRTRLYMIAVAAENGKIENFGEGPGASDGFDFFTSKIKLKEMAIETAKSAISLLSAAECPSGKMPVVIGNGFGGVIFHEACGHPFEASSVSKKLSVFWDKLGKQVANPIVNAVDDGTIPFGWGSTNVDDEGFPAQKVQLIKDGVLNSFMIDQFNGRRMKAEQNGHSRRQNYKFEPTSRMTNTYIENGPHTVEQIIAATQYGLYAKKMGGGSVNPATGEFNFTVSEGYMIRDGKIAEPVKGAALVGKGDETLAKIDMVANDLARAQGMCGAASGSIPTDVGQPTIRVTEITVGGRRGGQ